MRGPLQTGVRGAHEISDEAAENIEDMIKRRCAEKKFDDVTRVVVAPTETKKVGQRDSPRS